MEKKCYNHNNSEYINNIKIKGEDDEPNSCNREIVYYTRAKKKKEFL